MNITEETKSGLRLLTTFSENEYKAIVDTSFNILLRRCDEDALSKGDLHGMDQLKVKRAFATLVCLIVEGGKANSSSASVGSILQEYKISPERRSFFAKLYDVNYSELRGLLARTGFNFPHIVGVDWRMDYCIKSDTLAHIGKPVYFVSLQTEKNLKLPEVGDVDVVESTKEQVEFTCNLEELQDLVSKMKDAVKQMERVQSELTP